MTELTALKALLDRHSLSLEFASQRSGSGDQGADLSYRVLLRDPARMDDLFEELRGLPGVSRVTGLKAEQESEI